MRALARFFARNHLAYVALFVVLGGTSYAASRLPRNSVGTREVKNASLLAKDFANRQLRPVQGPQGARGLSGDAGPAGPQGPPGGKGRSASSDQPVQL